MAIKTKTITNRSVANESQWTIVEGCLKRAKGRPGKTTNLFKLIAEKIPYEFLETVKRSTERKKLGLTGVYIAHDSMGYPRYIGRGNVFDRLEARRKAQELELRYFSFYIVSDKKHEREIENIMIRAAGPLLDFNDRKVRVDIQPGDVKDFEPGTAFYERQYRKGPKVKLSVKKDVRSTSGN